MPSLSVFQPPNNLVVKVNQPFLVTGRASDLGPPEPNLIDSVTVQVDGGPPVRAALTRIPDKKNSVVSFKAFVQVTGGQDPHAVSITATNDIGRTVKQTVAVFTNVAFQVDSPAVIIDISPYPIDLTNPKEKKKLDSMLSQIQYGLLPLSAAMASIGKVLSGPNVLVVNNDIGVPVLRMGIWIEDASFPVLPPAPPDFPLPRVPDPGVTGAFATIPLLPVPEPTEFSPAFAISIPVAALQKLVDAGSAALMATASQQGISIDSLAIQTGSPGAVTLSVVGHLPLNIPFTLNITEFLGTHLVPHSRTPQRVPAVIGTSHTQSVGNLLEWLVGVVLEGPSLLYALDLVWYAGGQAADQVTGIIAPLVAGMPPRIPFSNNALPDGFVAPDFPVLVLNWTSFGATDSAITGGATTSIQPRDQTEVGVGVTGPTPIRGYASDLSGGFSRLYDFTLTNLVPDAGKFTWQVSGSGAAGGRIDVSGFQQSGRFAARFPLPFHVTPREFPFTLALSATESCGTDSSKKLTATAAMTVNVDVLKDPKVPQ